MVKGCEENAITINTLVKSTINAVVKRSQAFLEVSKTILDLNTSVPAILLREAKFERCDQHHDNQNSTRVLMQLCRWVSAVSLILLSKLKLENCARSIEMDNVKDKQ